MNYHFRRRACPVTTREKGMDKPSLRATIMELQRRCLAKKEAPMPVEPVPIPENFLLPKAASEFVETESSVLHGEGDDGMIVVCDVGINCKAASSADIMRAASDAVGKIVESLWQNVEKSAGSMVHLMVVVEKGK